MNFQIFKILINLGYIVFNFILINLTKTFFSKYIFSCNLKKFFFFKDINIRKKNFFFYIIIKYIIYGNVFIFYYLLCYFNKYLIYFYKKNIKKNIFKKKNRLVNLIKFEKIKVFKICFKIKKNLIKKYSVNLTRNITEKNSLIKIINSIL